MTTFTVSEVFRGLCWPAGSHSVLSPQNKSLFGSWVSVDGMAHWRLALGWLLQGWTRRRPHGAGSQGLPCGDSSRVAAARWPSIQAHTQLSPAFLNPPGFSKMTLTWRMEAEALNSAEPGLQLFASFMGSPHVAVTVLKWGALASEGCFRFHSASC